MTPEDMREAFDLAMEDGLALLEAAREILAPEGRTWDVDSITDDREFMAFFVDLSQRPAPSPFSVLDYLPTVAPAYYQQLVRRFERVRGRMMQEA